MTQLLIIAEKGRKMEYQKGRFAKNEDGLCQSSNF